MPSVDFGKPDVVKVLAFVYRDTVLCKLFSQTEVLKDVNISAKLTTISENSYECEVTTDQNGYV